MSADSFRAIVKSSNVEPLKLPARSPNLNVHAERWVKSVKDECLSKLILFGEASLRRALREYLVHYHAERNHQGKGNVLLHPVGTSHYPHRCTTEAVACRERLGGQLDWFEVIYLYGTESGWERLKKLVDTHIEGSARHQAYVNRIAPEIRNIHAYWLARRGPAGEATRGPQQPRRKASSPGRNDPCPCGSGKKFKRCHGAPETLH
jgi:hypothetical protein